MAKKQLKTVSDYVEAMGGAATLAELLEVDRGVVYNWKAKGKFPTGQYVKLGDAFKSRRIGNPMWLYNWS